MALAGGGSTDEIYEAVRERILSGALPPPAPVRQDALAQSLGVSKIPLREALVRLEQDGLLSLEKNRGFFVRPLDAEEAEEVFALRLKIEPECIALGALNATPEDQEAARAALEALDHEVEANAPAFRRAAPRFPPGAGQARPPAGDGADAGAAARAVRALRAQAPRAAGPSGTGPRRARNPARPLDPPRRARARARDRRPHRDDPGRSPPTARLEHDWFRRNRLNQ